MQTKALKQDSIENSFKKWNDTENLKHPVLKEDKANLDEPLARLRLYYEINGYYIAKTKKLQQKRQEEATVIASIERLKGELQNLRTSIARSEEKLKNANQSML